MNPFFNPIFTFRILKHYSTDIKRPWKKNHKELQKYQSYRLKKIIKYAYKIPIYHEKFKNAGIQPSDIKSIEDIKKVPLVSKEEIIGSFPNEVVPSNFKKNKSYLVSTTGSSNRPISLYQNLTTISIDIFAHMRQFKALDLSWRKTKIINIGDFTLNQSWDEECLKKGFISKVSPFFSLDNLLCVYTGEKLKVILEKIKEFNPEVILGYTSILRAISYVKKKQNIEIDNLKYIISSGEVLDPYTKHYIEEAFDSPVLNLYASTEGGTMAFECLKGGFHINNDLIYIEILDDEGNQVSKGEIGNVIITKLIPGITPIIRYSGLGDIASIANDFCNCGINTQLLDSLEGRKKDIIFLPNGRIFPPATIPLPLFQIATKSNKYRIKRFQFIQREINKIEILIELEEKYKKNDWVNKQLLKEIKKSYEELTDNLITIETSFVEEFENNSDSRYPPQIISKI